ncbi:TUL4 family outer member lipoprotein LpnB [Francisella hispaniensis]|uniref:TUL4 family outer member lipoprotein LpnB n=1 Tax=Francisella hispaniensis TaxID=622488 RepID=UPI0019032111|nr:TUL4 family lipoprotein [Francisella hispaniensis]MBK2356049.1 lipoprotein [Francisella hispaniensis]
MKKILIFTLMTVTLAGCSKYNAFIDKLYDSDNSIKVNPDDNLDNPDQDGEVVSEDKPTATLKLKYKAATHEIDARIVTNWNGAPQGTIYLTWVAPKDTNCYSTSFPITKFNETQDYTVDSQSVLSDDKVCDGTWTALIVNKSDNSELAKASLEIK